MGNWPQQFLRNLSLRKKSSSELVLLLFILFFPLLVPANIPPVNKVYKLNFAYKSQTKVTLGAGGSDSARIVGADKAEEIVAESEQLWSSDKAKSETLILRAFDLFKTERITDSLRARAYHLMGKLLVHQLQYQAGIDTLLKCIELKKRVYGSRHYELANTFNYLGITYFKMRKYDDALEYYNLAVTILKQNKQVDINLYDANLNLGIVSAAKGQYDQAYTFFDSAMIVLDTIGSSVDSLSVARFYFNYGFMATQMGKFSEAIQYYSTAESMYRGVYGPDYLSIAGININMGINAYYKYDYAKAKLFYQKALSIYLKNDKPGVGIPRAYNNLSVVSIKTGDFGTAIQHCLSGLKYEPDDYLKLLFFQNLADSYASLGDKTKAEFYYLAAIDLLRSGQVNPTKSISLYSSYADFLFDNKRIEKSKEYYDTALEICKLYTRADSKVYASLLSKIGDYYRYFKNDNDSALLYYDKSIVVWQNILITRDVEQSESFDDIRFLDAYLGKAQVLANQFNEDHKFELLKESYDIYKWALDKAGEIKGYLDSETQLILNEKFRKAYEEVVDITYLMYQETAGPQYKEMAFEFAERIKSSVLLSAVQNINALKTTDVPEELIRSEQQLQQEVNGMKKLLVDEQMKAHPSKKRVDFINSRLLQLMIDYDSMVARIEQNYPRYFALKYDRSVIKISELTEQLQDDEVLVEYVLSDSALTIFCVGEDVNYFSQTSIDSGFNTALDRLINLKNVNLARHSKADMVEFIKDANLLWTFLIEPVYSQIKGKRLIIVPDGLLGYLSFDLLLSSSSIPEELDYKQLSYLFKEFPISYSYSSSLRFNPYFQRKEVFMHELIAFAPENKQGKTGRSKLTLLPNSGEEVKEVTAVFGGNAYLEEDATKSRFLKEAVDYKIIHLAMHTLINDSLPMLSELLFYQDENNSSSGKLLTYEVFGLRLAAELVVLSACNTGYGRLQKGEGIMSLARGFKYAGVPSLILTLWEVQDKATSGIMKRFYVYLKAGDNKDEALRKAKLDFLADANRLKSHPYYWSSFLISGDAEQIIDKSVGNKTNRLVYFGITILVLLLALGYSLKKKERKKT